MAAASAALGLDRDRGSTGATRHCPIVAVAEPVHFHTKFGSSQFAIARLTPTRRYCHGRATRSREISITTTAAAAAAATFRR